MKLPAFVLFCLLPSSSLLAAISDSGTSGTTSGVAQPPNAGVTIHVFPNGSDVQEASTPQPTPLPTPEAVTTGTLATVPIDGIVSIKFGASADDIKSAMALRAARFLSDSSTAAVLNFEGGTFNDRTAKSWQFFLRRGKMYKATLIIAPGALRQYQTYNDVVEGLKKKYGDPFEFPKSDLSKDEIYREVGHQGRTFSWEWRSEKGGKRSIICQFFPGDQAGVARVRLIYEEDDIDSKAGVGEHNDF